MPDNATVIAQTRKWLSTVVIELGLCPFARREFESDRIHYAVIREADLERQLEQLILHCAALDKDDSIETSLLIFPKALSDYQDYLDILSLATDLLDAQGYSGIYQLASFHPAYCFAKVKADDASHYTNRSPYPMLHILREGSLEAALKSYPNPENIPERNIELTRKIGVKAMQNLLAQCYK